MKLLFTLILSFLAVVSTQADNISSEVLLNVKRAQQENPQGYNVVDELCTQMYKTILNGEVKLWEDHTKKFQIKASSLLNFERKFRKPFSSTNEIWVYERWTKKPNGETITEVEGLAFVNQVPLNSNNSDLMYGYVDIKDAQSFLAKYIPKCNAYGYCNLNLMQIINEKKFRYNVMMMNGKEIVSNSSSEKIKTRFFQNALNSNADSMAKLKEVSYSILYNESSNLTEANVFIKSVEAYLRENPQIILNSGANSIINYLDEKELRNITISKITITEQWGLGNNEFFYLPKNFAVTINGLINLNAIPFTDLYNWDLDITFQQINKLINDKYFNYNIVKINNQPIDDANDNDLKAIRNLYNKNW